MKRQRGHWNVQTVCKRLSILGRKKMNRISFREHADKLTKTRLAALAIGAATFLTAVGTGVFIVKNIHYAPIRDIQTFATQQTSCVQPDIRTLFANRRASWSKQNLLYRSAADRGPLCPTTGSAVPLGIAATRKRCSSETTRSPAKCVRSRQAPPAIAPWSSCPRLDP